MNELIIRLTGAVTESNFDVWKEAALSQVRSANRELKTDEDFSWAEDTIKSCKENEQAIKKAKEEALNQTADINKLFAAMDQIAAELARTRLSLEKQVKNEKERRKQDVIDAGISQVEQLIKDVKDANSDLTGVSLVVDGAMIRQAVIGKKTIDGMKKAVDTIVEHETARIQRLANMAQLNLQAIAGCEAEFPGIFPDKKSLCVSSAVEVSAIIEARVANAKLAKAEILKRKEEEIEAKAKAEYEAEAKVAEQAVQSETSFSPPEPPPPSSTPLPGDNQPAMAEGEQDFIFTVHLHCTKDEAVELARDMEQAFGKSDKVISFFLTRK